MKWFGLSVPVLQAPIGSAATVALATAVGRAGGLGSLAMTWTEPFDAKAQIANMQGAGVPYFLNYVLRFGNERPRAVLQRGIPAVTFSWGIDAELIAHARALAIKVGVQAGTSLGAKQAVAAGADFVIVQGNEAGGHVQSTTPLQQLLADTVELGLNVPLIAAGGIASGGQIATCLKHGASGVMLGTRFLASAESLAHDAHKQAIMNAQPNDTAFTNCFDIDWPFAMHRVIRNSTLEMWEAAGSPAAPHRPGEGDVIGTQGGHSIIRYSDTPPMADAQGDVLAACLYAGTGVEHIASVLPAADIVMSLWADAQRHLQTDVANSV